MRTVFIGTDLYYSEDFVNDMQENYRQEIERLNNIIIRNRKYLEIIIDDLIIPIYDADTIKKYTGLSVEDVKNEFLKYYDKESIK